MDTAPDPKPPFAMPAPCRVIRASVRVLRDLGHSDTGAYAMVAEIAHLAATAAEAGSGLDPWWLRLIELEASARAGVTVTPPSERHGDEHGRKHT